VVDSFLRSYLRFSGGRIVADDRRADGAEVGMTGQTIRRISVTSDFGKTVVFVNNGHLPYPFGRDITGYRGTDLDETLAKATAAGATVLWGPYEGEGRASAMVRFPGGYIAEIHDGA